MKKFLKIVLYLILLIVALFVGLLVYTTLDDYNPKSVETIAEAKGSVINVYDTIKMFDWNIGYCGLGDDMSFFYDGGDRMRTTKERTYENLKGIMAEMEANDTVDFYLIQEIDKKSHRSYKINEYDSVAALFPNFKNYFGKNYDVDFIPVPPSNPMGKVKSGIATFSRWEPFSVKRHPFIGNYAWPKSLFLLDRCFMVQRFYTSNGKELLIINTHNSAYDDGTLRRQQMEDMKKFLLDEYAQGNYVLVGGDWNQNPPKEGEASMESKDKHLTRIRIASDFMPEGWDWEFCEKIPTNRMIDEAYNPKTTVTTTIDFYLLSPNLKAVTLKNIDLQYKNSDHNPVLLSFAFLH